MNNVYLEEYLSIINENLKKHKGYRPDMEFSRISAHGDVVLKTRDSILSTEDRKIFDDVIEIVNQQYKLIIL